MSMEKHGDPEPILNPEQLEALANPLSEEQEIADTLERGGPWITVTFTSNDGAFTQSRVMTLEEAEGFVAELSSEVARAKAKYNIDQESSNE